MERYKEKVGKIHYSSSFPTKKDFLKLIVYRIVFLVLFCISLYLMYSYIQEPYHPVRFRQMNDGRMIDMTHSIFIVSFFIALLSFIKVFTCSYKVYIIGEKGCIVYTFKTKKHYSVKTQMFHGSKVKFEECLQNVVDEKL